MSRTLLSGSLGGSETSPQSKIYDVDVSDGTYYLKFYRSRNGAGKYTLNLMEAISSSSITLNKTSLTLGRYDGERLAAYVWPSDATNQAVLWKSSNPSVATVSDGGFVSARSAGTATITATAADGSGAKATCVVTVQEEKVSGLKKVNGVYYYLSNGQVQKNYTGLVKFEGAWFYVTNGKLDTGIKGLVDYQGGKFLFSQGKRRDDISGLWFYIVDHKWYYLSHGQVQNKYTGVAFYNKAAFYVVNGVLAKDMNDVITYNGKQFKVTNGCLSSRPIK